jgi:hypothetical protein
MGISASTMTCPSCEKQLLETLSTAFGTWERCPNCTGIFIHEDLIAAASADHAKCAAALEEPHGLLLPTERTRPKCLQKLFDGRVQSRGVIFSLCPTCKSLWTNHPTLRQFEEAIEKTLAAETQAAGVGGPGYASGAASTSKFYEDSGLGSLFRGIARTFDRVADSFRPSPSEDDSILKEEKAAKKKKEGEDKAVKKSKPEKLIRSVEPAPPAAVPPIAELVKAPELVTESPKIEIPNFIFPEEPPEPVIESPKAEPVKEPIPEPQPEPIPEPKPEPKRTPAPAPVPQKIVLSGTAPRTGIFAKLKAAWSPKPKKTTPKSPATQQGGRAPEVWRSVPAVNSEKLSTSAEPPIPIPFEQTKPKPVAPPKPAKPAPAPKPVKPAPAPKPKKESPPREPFDHVAFWPPWILGISGALLSGLRDYGFEGAPAVLWAIMGWSVGMMMRLKRLYPFKTFQETSLQALSELKGPSGWKGIPVSLKGEIVLAREEDPKGVVVFKQDTRTMAMNKLGRWDVIPRLFGLSNPRQLLKGEVTIRGWYRTGLVPSIEVHQVQANKAFRKSMTRALRWIFAVLVFFMAFGIYLSLD